MAILFGEESSALTKAYKVTSSVASLLIMTSFTVFVFYISFQHYTLYSWHPSFFTLGALAVMAQAILALSTDNYLQAVGLERRKLVMIHWILQLVAGAAIAVGFVSIYMYKYNYNSLHFESWHAVTGLVFTILFVVGCVDGLVTFFASSFKNCMKPAYKKLLHIVLGILTFVMGIISQGFGIYTSWFLYYSNSMFQLVSVVLIAFATLLTLQNSVVSACSRVKRALM